MDLQWALAGLLLLVALWLGGHALADRLRAGAMARWPVARGKVALTGLDSERRIHRHAARLVHLPTIAYRYSAGGADHIGSRISNVEPVFEQEAEAEHFLARFPAGAAVDVHYNPAAPNEALLDPRAPDLRPRLGAAIAALVAALLLVVL